MDESGSQMSLFGYFDENTFIDDDDYEEFGDGVEAE